MLLATVENGEITDRRTLAKSKIENYGTNPVTQTTVSFSLPHQNILAGAAYASCTVDPIYSKVMIYNAHYNFFGVFDLTTQLFDFVFNSTTEKFLTNHSRISTGSLLNQLSLRYVNGELQFYSLNDIYNTLNLRYDIAVTMF